MKIAFCLFKYFPYGGLQNDFLDIASECHARGHQIVVYTCDWQGERPEAFTIHQIDCHASANHVKYQRYYQQIQTALQLNSVDLVVGFNKMPGLDIYFASDPSYLLRERSFLEKLLPRYRHFREFEAAVFSSTATTRILVLSEAQQQGYGGIWHTDASRFISMPAGIHRSACADSDQQMAMHRQHLRLELGVQNSDLLLLMIGSGFRTKGLDRALLVIQALPDALRVRVQLRVIGQDKAAPFEKMVRDLGLQDQVRILPGRDDIAAVMQAGDVLLHPAYREVAGKVILEAVVAGLPVLVSDVCGYAHHVTAADAGVVLASPYRQDECNRMLEQMLNGEKRPEWRKNGILYGLTQSLYGMAEAAADAIESAKTSIETKR